MGNQRRRKKLTPEEEIEAFEAINRGYSGNIFDKIKIDIKSKTPNQKWEENKKLLEKSMMINFR
jgi:hypothetical protein